MTNKSKHIKSNEHKKQEYCGQCGNKLQPQAKFCTVCGEPIHTVSKDETINSEVATGSMPEEVETKCSSGVLNNMAVSPESDSSTISTEQGNESTMESAAEVSTEVIPEAMATEESSSAQSANFKAAMDSSKRKSKRKIPMVVLVAIITMLTAGVAFAAYYVYTEVIVPQQEQAAQEAAEQERIEAEQSAIAQAEENYAPLLDEYRLLSSTYAGDPEKYLEDIVEDTAFITKKYGAEEVRLYSAEIEKQDDLYPHIGGEAIGLLEENARPLAGDDSDSDAHLYFCKDFSYAFIDLNEDSNYELAVNFSSADDFTPGSVDVLYGFVDNEIVVIEAAYYRKPLYVTKDNYIYTRLTGGADYHWEYVFQWNGEGNTLKEMLAVELVDGHDYSADADADNSPRKVTTIIDGKEETRTVANSEIEDIVSKYTVLSGMGSDECGNIFDWQDL